MLAPLTAALVVVLVMLAALTALATVRGRQIDNPTFYVACAAELLIVVQLVVGIVRSGDGAAGMSAALFIAYLAGLVAVLPIAGFWAVAERESRWGTGVLLVATLGLLVMVARLVQIWNGHG
ncbi:hypothetical protein PZ938_01050 [Luteipulveratus sp. YIM 133132]|uniref:hypothetical protein n=1 Tax=Luteipulveratus flavus TaxID=3031728 RepID=UPI0023AF5FD5|nr:hypothetical protein [Luteipulveratus sp. YIM 133132]MDE9364182.1 hypothetical protein [Luteipulveratus sp. YIM 133132]